MERRSSPARRAALVGTALLLLVGLTGCNGKGPVGRGPVASVDGHDISLDDVREFMDAQVAFMEAVKEASAGTGTEAQAQATLNEFLGDNDHTLGTAGAAQVLSTLVQLHIQEDLAADNGVEVTAEDRAQATQTVESQLEQYDIDEEAIEALVELQVRLGAVNMALARGFDDTAPYERRQRAFFEDNQDAFADGVCVQQIATTDEASARAAAERLAAGDDFAEVAEAHSVQPQLGVEGDPTSCIPRENLRGVFPAETDTVAADDVIGPADGGGSWIIVRVWDEGPIEFEGAQPMIQEQLTQGLTDPSQAVLLAALDERIDDASVTVDPRFGTWDPVRGGVVAPTDPLAEQP